MQKKQNREYCTLHFSEGKTVKEAVDAVAAIEQMVLDKFYSDK